MQLALQSVSLIGALIVLVAFVALQNHRWSAEHPRYLWCNLVGATMLAAVAIVDRRLGFILLEAIWGLVTLQTLIRVRRQDRSGPS